jgi:Domain of unknown function (DUF397)
MDLDLSRAAWRTSTYSGANGSCVEVAPVPDGSAPDGARPARIAVRDSKDRSGPVLVFTARQWRDLAAGIKSGELLLS